MSGDRRGAMIVQEVVPVYIDVPQRPEGRWRQIASDGVAPAYESDWLRSVADARLVDYDRIRPYVTRGVLTLAVVVAFTQLPGTHPLAWLALVLPVVQVTLEIALEAKTRARREPDDAGALAGPMVGVAYRNYELRMLNVTGTLGAVACAVLVLAVAFGTGTTGPAWVRVAALACALLYTSSGILGPLAEATVYSPLQHTPGWLRRLRPLLWLVAVALAVVVVALSSRWPGAWPDGSLPYAYLVCALPYYVGLRIREFERAAHAAGQVAVRAREDANRQASFDLHELLQVNHGPLDAALAQPGLVPADRLRLELFGANLRMMYARARAQGTDLQAGVLPSVAELVAHVCAPELVRPTVDVEIGSLDPEHGALAKVLISTLVNNAVQAYAQSPDVQDRRLLVSARVVGGHVDVLVSDTLPALPARAWDPNGTLGHMRQEIADRGGVLEEVPVDIGKALHARWPATLTPLRAPTPSDRKDLP